MGLLVDWTQLRKESGHEDLSIKTFKTKSKEKNKDSIYVGQLQRSNKHIGDYQKRE